jgi:hypothetical protein
VAQLHRRAGDGHVPDTNCTLTTVGVRSADQQHVRDQQSHTAKAAPARRQIEGGISDGCCEYRETAVNVLRVLRVLRKSVQPNGASR